MAQRGRKLDSGDHLWLNRHLINEAFAQAGRGDLLNSAQATFDAVIVSDAGKQFAVSRRTKGGGTARDCDPCFGHPHGPCLGAGE